MEPAINLNEVEKLLDEKKYPLLSDKQYTTIAKFVYQYSGINLGDKKRSLVHARLYKRLAFLDCANWAEYIDLLTSNDTGREIPELINSITTNKTEFFREREHFNIVINKFLPEILKQNNVVYFWSAAASTGQEAYTIAMILEEAIKGVGAFFSYRILGTDIDTNAIRKANEGIYKAYEVDGFVPPEFKAQYFLRGNKEYRGFYKVKDEIKKDIKFRHYNLRDSATNIPVNFDIVFLRNVLIYFDATTREQVVNNIIQNINPKGYLILGHSESLHDVKCKLKYYGSAIYQKE